MEKVNLAGEFDEEKGGKVGSEETWGNEKKNHPKGKNKYIQGVIKKYYEWIF